LVALVAIGTKVEAVNTEDEPANTN